MNDPRYAYDHYGDARYYDHAYARYKQDVSHYVSLATELGGPVLELGAGTGRIAIQTARAGVDVVMVDRTQTMLDRAEERLAKQPKRVRARIRLVQADLRELALRETFPLITAPFNVLQHLYTRVDIERALATVRRHLAPEGRFAFDVLNPDPDALRRDPDRFYRCRPITHPKNGERYAYSEAFEYDHDAQIQTTLMRFESMESDDVFFVRLTQRQFFPRELDALLHYNGLEVLERAGGFGGEPVDGLAESMVFLTRAARRPGDAGASDDGGG